MNPILLQIGPITLRTYGLFVAIGVLAGYNYVLILNSYKKHFPKQFISNLSFFSIVIGFIGARIVYVLNNLQYYKDNISSVIKFWEGGLIFYGGITTGILFGIIYTLLNKKNLLDILDLYAPAIFLGLSIGRIGCFSAGCCYGIPTESFLGIVFTHPESLAPTGVKLFPTQLVESIFSLLLFIFLHLCLIKEKFKHRILFIGVGVYSIYRFIIEFYRGDPRGKGIIGISFSQDFSIVLLLLTTVLIISISKNLKLKKL